MIQIEGLHKYYNRNKNNECHALKEVCLEIREGEMVAIMGKSGAGKSTLLHILSGIDRFDAGDVRVDGLSLSGVSDGQLARYRNQTVGIVLQDFGLIDDYTVLDNVLIPLYFAGETGKKAKARASDVLHLLGIGGLSRHKASELSGGQRQRVAIARAIVHAPSYLMADEPTGALDAQTTEDILAVFKRLNQAGITVIIVTHDPLVAEFCDRTIQIADGRIAPSHEMV